MIKFVFNDGLLKAPHKRVKTPTMLQIDSMECGAVCLSIILAYHGLHIAPETAREMCGVTRDGSKAINIIKAARKLGMEAEGKRIKELNTLIYMPTPFIIYWKFEHFLVVEGINKKKVYINDPAMGRRVISLEELDKGYTGVALYLVPSKEFKPAGKKEKSVFSLLASYLKGDFLELTYLFLASALLAFPEASLALFIEFFVDNILIKNQRQWMLGFTIIMGFIVLITILLLWIQRYYLVRYKLRFAIKKIPRFFNKLLYLPMSFYIQRATGDISNRMSIFDEVSATITNSFSESVIGILSLIIFSLIITLINPIIGLITIGITLLNFASVIFTNRIIIDLGRRFSQDQAKMHSIEYSGVQMMEALKFMNGENRFFSRWYHYKAKLIDSQQTIDFYKSLISLLPSTLYFFNLVLLIIIGTHAILNGSMTVGGMIAIYTLLLLFPDPVGKIVNDFLKINELKGYLLRINDVLLFQQTSQKSRKISKIKTQNLLEIRDVYFGYSKLEAPILSEINLTLKAGKSAALTGISGGGKSSLLNLVGGLYEPWVGDIYLLGKSIKNYSATELFKLISYVDQNIFLFEGTLRDNLTMWNKNIDNSTIIDAMKMACIDELVDMKGGLDYQILEGGVNISLGQAQRIEIARALIKKPQLILLDEATSALDSITEAKIYQNLHQMNCAFLSVAHRLSAVRNCDEIIVLEDSMMVERGNHQKLIEINGRYKQFLEKDYLL